MPNENRRDFLSPEQKLLAGRIRAKIYYAKNAEIVRAKRRARYQANPAKEIERAIKWNRANRLHRNDYENKLYWDNPDKYRAKARASMARTRARRKALGKSVTSMA